MPKKIDPKVKERCVQQMLEHAAEYPNPTATAEVVAKRNGVGAETVRRWYLQAQVDSGQRQDGRIDCCSVAETWYPCSSQGHGHGHVRIRHRRNPRHVPEHLGP